MSVSLPAKKNSNSTSVARTNKSVVNLNSTDALAMVEHSSELKLNITTPVGTRFICRTAFIGTHSDRYLLAEVPNISSEDMEFYFQEGFWINIRALSTRGEGAMIHFRSQLLHVIQEPIPFVMLSIPNTMQVTQLRKEPRYEVNLPGKVLAEEHKANCEVRDLSKSGCRFIAPPIGRTYQVGDIVSVELYADQRGSRVFAPLTGRICNLQRSTHYARYGMEFNELGQANAKNLLSQLKFNGTKLTLNIEQS